MHKSGGVEERRLSRISLQHVVVRIPSAARNMSHAIVNGEGDNRRAVEMVMAL